MWGRMKSCARLSTAQYKPPAGLDKPVTNPLQVVNLPHAYLRAPRWGFLSLDCRSLRALRLGLLMANVPLP
jgi:hypothetical protein